MIFVGGTGRSGTTIMVQALQADRRYAVFIEPRFITDPGGLMDYYANQVIDRQTFVDNVAGRFLPKMVANLRRFKVLPEPGKVYTSDLVYTINAGLSPTLQRTEFSRAFTQRFLGAIHRHTRSHDWVYKDPHAIMWAGYLYQLFPTARFVHMVRDPRDVCASVMRRNWGPGDAAGFCRWYNRLMAPALRAARAIPPDRYTVLSIEKFGANPVGTLELLYGWLGNTQPSDTMKDRVRTMVMPEQVNQGRWKAQLTQQEATLVQRECGGLYQQWLDLMTL